LTEFNNRRDLERWLKARPREDAVVIAARAALRVLPFLITALVEDAGKHRAAIVLPVFCALAAPWVAAVGPTQGAEVRKAAAADAYAAAAAAAGYADDAHAVEAVDAANAAGYAADAYALDTAADAAADAADAAAYADAAYAGGTVWKAVSADATALEQGQSPEHVATSPLWPETRPDWATEAWAWLEDHLLKAGDGWLVWTGWYEDRLHGRPFNKALEEARVLIDPDLWDQGPKAVNAEIARLIDQHTDNPRE